MRDPADPALRDMLITVKRAVKRQGHAHGASYAYGHTVDFPVDPKELSKAAYDHAFGVEAPVRCAEPHAYEIGCVARIKFLRSSARSDASDGSASSAPAANSNHMMAQFISAMAAQFTSPNIALCSPARALSAGVMQPLAPQHAPPMAALMPPMAALMPPQQPPPLPRIEDASVDALAEMRREMAAAHATAVPLAPRKQTKLKTMKGNAKAAAAGESEDEGGTDDGDATDIADAPVVAVKRRPACAAAATPSTRKRPAAALLNTRKTITSRAYDTCYRTLIAKGKTIDAAKTAARKAHSAAASKHDATA